MANFDFTIPIRTPTGNELLRMQWFKRTRSLKNIAWHIRSQAIPPPKPFVRARVEIHRYTPRQLDEDKLGSIAVGILDALQPCSKRHPVGMGFITGDDPDHLELTILTVKSSAVATRIIELDRGIIRSYPGNYTAYERLKEDQLASDALASARALRSESATYR